MVFARYEKSGIDRAIKPLYLLNTNRSRIVMDARVIIGDNDGKRSLEHPLRYVLMRRKHQPYRVIPIDVCI